MNRTERNTDLMSTERIWLRCKIDEMWYNNNNAKKTNTIQETIDFLTRSATKAKLEGYEDVVVIPLAQDSTEDSLGASYIYVEGLRRETNAEYKRRLKSEFYAMKRSRENWEQRCKYYESNGDVDRLNAIQTALKTIDELAKD